MLEASEVPALHNQEPLNTLAYDVTDIPTSTIILPSKFQRSNITQHIASVALWRISYVASYAKSAMLFTLEKQDVMPWRLLSRTHQMHNVMYARSTCCYPLQHCESFHYRFVSVWHGFARTSLHFSSKRKEQYLIFDPATLFLTDMNEWFSFCPFISS